MITATHPMDPFDQHRPLLFSIAYRMLGSVGDAEDLVQEAFLRWSRSTSEPVESPRAYLTAIVTRLAIDQLKSARARREHYPGTWLPEPIVSETDPSVLAESLSMALLVLLESLTPVERAVYLLRESFDYDYSEIANITGKSEDNCRQLYSRASRFIADRRPRFRPSPDEQQRLTEQFLSTVTTGDLPGLVALLAGDITLWADGGGKTIAPLNPIHGPDNVSRLLVGLRKKAAGVLTGRVAVANNSPAVIVSLDGRIVAVLTLEIAREADGVSRIQAIYQVVNPEKLGHVQ